MAMQLCVLVLELLLLTTLLLSQEHLIISVNSLIDAIRFDYLWTWTFTKDDTFKETLRELNFDTDDTVGKRIRGSQDLLFLIRPIKENPEEEDWFLSGINLLDEKNWSINVIDSDGM